MIRSDVERQGCAQGLGLTASTHVDMVLPKLTETLEKITKAKKGGGFFSSFGGKGNEDDLHKSTVVLCYGYAVAYADPAYVCSLSFPCSLSALRCDRKA